MDPGWRVGPKSCQQGMTGATGVASDNLGWVLSELSIRFGNVAAVPQGNSHIGSLQGVS
jgi:hypothetical protein